MMKDKKSSFRFPKEERLKSRISIDELFEIKNQLKSYPLKIFYQIGSMDAESPSHLQVSFSVPKRLFKSAVKRNYIKRRILEAYRLHRNPLKEICEHKGLNVQMMFIYVSHEVPTYHEVEQSVKNILEQLEKKL